MCEFRRDELVLILPQNHRLQGDEPIAFAQTLDEAWVSLNPGAALLQQQQAAALAAGRPLKLRIQVKSFDAVGHMVASGLGIALLPKLAAQPILQSMGLNWRPLLAPWAQRVLQLGVRRDADPVVLGLRDFLR